MTEYVYIPSLGKHIEVEELDTGAKLSKARRRETIAYVQILLQLAAECAKATGTPKAFVWLWLRYEAWNSGGLTISCPDGPMLRHGVSGKVKRQALRRLEAAGLISVQRPPGLAPIVTLIGDSWTLPRKRRRHD